MRTLPEILLDELHEGLEPHIANLRKKIAEKKLENDPKQATALAELEKILNTIDRTMKGAIQ